MTKRPNAVQIDFEIRNRMTAIRAKDGATFVIVNGKIDFVWYNVENKAAHDALEALLPFVEGKE